MLDGLDRGLRERLRAHVPLVGQHRLDDDVAAVAARHHRDVLVDALEQALRLEIGEDALARDEPVEAAVRAAVRYR